MEFNSDFCFKAADSALKKSSVSADDIGLIICVTNTPDTTLPQVFVTVQSRLNISEAITIDLRGGCVAPLQGLLMKLCRI